MNRQTKVAGVILAGGRGRRMDNRDKGLVEFNGRPMIEYAITALTPVVDAVYINANRHIERYRSFGFPVISDESANFDGPLAGVLAAMKHTDADVLLIMPCDSPLLRTEHLQKLLTSRAEHHADVAVAFDGKRLHPVVFSVRAALKDNLQQYLAEGQRKVEHWLVQQHCLRTDFSGEPEIFANINTMDELSAFAARPNV